MASMAEVVAVLKRAQERAGGGLYQTATARADAEILGKMADALAKQPAVMHTMILRTAGL